MKITESFIRLDGEYRQTVQELKKQLASARPLPIIVNGLSGGATDAFLASCATDVRESGSFSIILADDEKECARIADVLSSSGTPAEIYPRRDFVFYPISASHDLERERISVLDGVMSGRLSAVVTTPAAALQYTMPPAVLRESVMELRVGSLMSPDDLVSHLVALGYVRCDTVDGAGQFARRGGIIDVFTDMRALPVRIEFFGDEIDRLGVFDPITQRVSGECDLLRLLPAREVTLSDNDRTQIRAHVASLIKSAKSEECRKTLKSELSELDGGFECAFADKYISAVYPSRMTLLDYMSLCGNCAVMLQGTNAIEEALRGSTAIEEENVRQLVTSGLVPGKLAAYSATQEEFRDFLKSNATVHINTFSSGLGSLRVAGMFGFRCRTTVSYDDHFPLLCEDLRNFCASKYRIVLAVRNDAEVMSTVASLTDEGFQAVPVSGARELEPEELTPAVVYVTEGVISSGYELMLARAAVITTAPANGKSAKKKARTGRRKSKSKGERIMSYADLTVGDYVVHDTHGIGVFGGLQTLTIDGVTRDYITINYAGKDKLFLPADRLESVSKYIGAKSEDGLVKLSKLGGTDWQKAKSRAKGAAKEMAKELISLYAERQRKPGISFNSDDDFQREFDESFEYEETDSQLTAIDEIKADMERSVPMDRLLCGDVGFGKTEVAFRAVFKAVVSGYQAAILVPTTILALQHFQTALSRMRGYPIKIEMLSRFRTARESAEILRRLRRGDIDLIIGTHRLLGQDVKFKNLGLLIVDEEQRFGVAQKEKLKALAGNVDVLTLTATPIPRTLNMAMSGIRDMSILDEAPGDRFPVQTYVLEHDDIIINEAIRRELARGGQVLYLYNFVETIDTVAARIARDIPDARITVAHGRMDREELEDIWQSLMRGEIDVLVCTTIIETGVDLPNANTLIIENADRLGLSQLHQIRGRVGRSNRHAYAYFTYRKGKALTEIATKRLEAIREYAEFGAGFKIALRDLEIRGAGNLLGAEQHGHIDSVGYDMYIRLLSEAILEERGEVKPERIEARADFRIDANIPDSYIPSQSVRMEMYKKISLIETPPDMGDVLDELCDRFGEPPIPTLRLLYTSLARNIASQYNIPRLEAKDGCVMFWPENADMEAWAEVFSTESSLRFTASAGKSGVICRLARGEDPCERAMDIMVAYANAKSALSAPDSGKEEKKEK